MSRVIINLVLQATEQTLIMVLAAGAISLLVGLPLAVIVFSASRKELYGSPWIARPLSLLIDALRAVPFIILLVILLPVTRWIVGTSLGTTAAIVPLSIAAIPYYARIAEIALRGVDTGLIEAVQVMGGSRWMVICYGVIPEALPSLISGLTVTLITLTGASAMAGAIGAGGLGDLAIRYGYQRFNTQVMVAVVIVLIALVGLIQAIGNFAARRAAPQHG
nr:methionine ABC transporter permease [uncultured Neokomagataea sp.]